MTTLLAMMTNRVDLNEFKHTNCRASELALGRLKFDEGVVGFVSVVGPTAIEPRTP